MIIITIYTYILKYVIEEINLFSYVYRCFAISLQGKVETVIVHPPRHARARPLTCLQ
jgi:hypothetical protein